jgi:glucokinase
MVDVVAAVDVGGTRIKSALVDASLDPVVELSHPTPVDLTDRIGPTVSDIVDDLVEATGGSALTIRGCGIVVPGLVDEESGTGLLSVNLGWRDLPIAAAVSDALAMPVRLGHDVRAGLLAESRVGAARGASNVLFLPIGTGIAGALLVDGHILSASGYAGELGHVVVEPGGVVCACGGSGCLETVSSGSAIRRRYREATGDDVGADVVADRAASGEPAAAAVWQGAVTGLARAVATTVTLTGAELVLVGGGVAESGDRLLEPLGTELASMLTFQRMPRIERAGLGDRAGCIGAACLAWDAA